uniref:Uncharacterized protein n=1 Tax=Amphimedon queenslandica TaxID=400682 RepID=A0A1X7TFV5_AMPQE
MSNALLPIIDLPPNDNTCIHSTSVFSKCQGQKLGIHTPCKTYDQPSLMIATAKIKCKRMNIVCQLEGLHMLTSFMGSIGFMMKGSCHDKALQSVYGGNAVSHYDSITWALLSTSVIN